MSWKQKLVMFLLILGLGLIIFLPISVAIKEMHDQHHCENACNPVRSMVLEGDCHCMTDRGWIRIQP